MRKPKIDIPWTDEEFEALKEHYPHPNGIKVIQALFPHRSYNSIKAMANVKFGLTRWTQYTKRNDFFSEPNDTNNVISGFFAADGCITSRDKRFVISISDKDRGYLERIRQHLEYNGPLTTHHSRGGNIIKTKGKEYVIKPSSTVTLQIADCPDWVSDLEHTWNITPRKTNTLRPPNLTNLRHILCYLSGLIDGDGWICLNKNRDSIHGKVLEISVMGTKELMVWVKRVFDYLTPGQTRATIKPTSSPNGAVFSVRGTRAYLLARIFLSLNILRLDRKWDNAREYVSLLEREGGITVKMQRWIDESCYDHTLIHRLQTEEILLPDIPTP